MNRPRTLTFGLVIAASLLLFASLWLTMWHLRMEAPQYQGSEALKVRVVPGRLTGDLREIRTLNQYIGVHLPVDLPEVSWLPWPLGAGALLGLVALALKGRARQLTLVLTASGVSLAILVFAAMAQRDMYRIGHDRDAHAALAGVKDFTPPLFGSVQIENFHVTSGLGAGGYLVGLAVLLQLGTGLGVEQMPRRWRRKRGGVSAEAVVRPVPSDEVTA